MIPFTLHNKPLMYVLFYKRGVETQWPRVTRVGKRRARLQTQAVWLQNLAVANTHREKWLCLSCLSLETSFG